MELRLFKSKKPPIINPNVLKHKRSIFLQLIKDHGLENRVEVNVEPNYSITLVLIISDSGEIPTIPGEFLREFLLNLSQGANPWKMSWENLQIGPPLRQEDIDADVRASELSGILAMQVND